MWSLIMALVMLGATIATGEGSVAERAHEALSALLAVLVGV